MAEEEGFEPPVPLRVRLISRHDLTEFNYLLINDLRFQNTPVEASVEAFHQTLHRPRKCYLIAPTSKNPTATGCCTLLDALLCHTTRLYPVMRHPHHARAGEGGSRGVPQCFVCTGARPVYTCAAGFCRFRRRFEQWSATPGDGFGLFVRQPRQRLGPAQATSVLSSIGSSHVSSIRSACQTW